MEEIEDRVFRFMLAIEKWDTTSIDENENKFDSLVNTNKALLDYLSRVLAKNRATLRYGFKKLKDAHLKVLTSDDKKFRIYCWYVGGGGTARSYNALIQYAGLKENKVVVLNDDSKAEEGYVCTGSVYSELHTIRTNSNSYAYLVIGNTIIWNGGGDHFIKAYAIDNGRLNDSIKFFKTASKKVNSISCYYDLTLGVNRNREVDFPHLKFSMDKQKLYVPLIKENDEITSKYLVYKFDGNYYVFDKNAK